jgi:hypothetical protein
MSGNIRDCSEVTMAIMPWLYPKEQKNEEIGQGAEERRNDVFEETNKLKAAHNQLDKNMISSESS